MYGYLPPLPSERNQRIYYEVMVMGRRQVDVARCWRVSQPRVAQIVKAVENFVAEFGPASKAFADRRFLLARLLYRLLEEGLSDGHLEALSPQLLEAANDAPRLESQAGVVTALPRY